MKKATDNDAAYQAIFDLVRSIPAGRVTTYGAVAKALGLKSGARMVGRAMGHTSGLEPAVPVQRVVSSGGVLSGDNGYRQNKLESEGVTVKGDRIVDFKRLFWDPLEELEA